MIKRVESWMRIEGIDPYIKRLGNGHPIIDNQGLSCETDSTTNISGPNAIRLSKHLTI